MKLRTKNIHYEPKNDQTIRLTGFFLIEQPLCVELEIEKRVVGRET